MTRPARARIDLDAARDNLRCAKRLATGARVLAVIKADGYGHGAVAIGKALAGEADAFGVACSEEALELRESGILDPILLMEGAFHPDEIALADRERLALVVHNRQQLDWLSAARVERGLECWLKMDSGMHRVGFAPEEIGSAYRALMDSPNVASVILMTHFARADELDQPTTGRQLALFDRAAGEISAPQSTANSAAILAWPRTHRDWVRPGIMLYGASPLGDGHASAAALRPGDAPGVGAHRDPRPPAGGGGGVRRAFRLRPTDPRRRGCYGLCGRLSTARAYRYAGRGQRPAHPAHRTRFHGYANDRSDRPRRRSAR